MGISILKTYGFCVLIQMKILVEGKKITTNNHSKKGYGLLLLLLLLF